MCCTPKVKLEVAREDRIPAIPPGQKGTNMSVDPYFFGPKQNRNPRQSRSSHETKSHTFSHFVRNLSINKNRPLTV